MMLYRTLVAVFATTLASVAGAASFSVSDPTEFQTALTAAQSNGEPDSITVEAGTYNINATLTYTAVASENFSLTIDGTDSDLTTLAGNSQVPILRIDTTAVTSDGGVSVDVSNMTFINGNASGTPDDGGALAILFDDSNQPAEFATIIFVRGSEFYDNLADDNGGAVYIRGPAIEGIYLDDLTFDGNSAGGDGGAAYVEGRFLGTPLFFNNIDFFDNVAQGSGGGLYAGGFDVDTASEDRATSISVTDITFLNNRSAGTGTADGGGGADLGASGSINVSVTGFIDNLARSGAGLRIRPNFGNITMVNNGFTGNVANEDGGAIAASNSIFTSVTLTNNTLHSNTATNRGGGVFLEFGGSSSLAQFYNNIIFANVAQQGAGDDLYVNNDSPQDIPALVDVFNNVITDIEVTPGPFVQADNINQDPTLVNIDLRPLPDPRLLSGSPAIDTGLNTAPSAPARDFEDDVRPNNGIIDIGMDEFTGAIAQNVDLAVTKVADANPVVEGTDITYTVTVTNNGPGDASSVSMVDTLDSRLGYVSATASQGACTEALAVVTCDLGSLANSATATVTIVVSTPDVPDNTIVTNTALVSGPETDPDDTNNSVSLNTTIIPAGPAQADLAVTKTGPSDVTSGTPFPLFAWDIVVTNNGPDDATNVVLTDTLPAGVTFSSADATVGACTDDSGVVTCDIGPLANGASSDIRIVAETDVVTDATDVVNSATVTATEEDPTPGNNAATATTTINPPESDLTLAISSTPDEPVINRPITYTVTVTNTGPSNSTGVTVIIDLPPEAAFVSATPSWGTCGDVVNNTLTCTIGEIPGPLDFETAVDIEIVVTAPGQTGTLTLSATVTADVADPTPGNNVSSQAINVIDTVDLVIEGTSEGTGSFGWIELLALLGMAGLVAVVRVSRRQVSALVLVAALPVVALLAANDAHAQSDWYIGGALGQASVDYEGSDLTSDLAAFGWTIQNATVDNDATAWKIYGGVSINKYFAIELGYVDLGKIMTSYSTSIPPDEINDILQDTFLVHPLTGNGVSAAAVLKWPFSDNFSLYGKAGGFIWQSEIEVRVVQGGTGQVAGDESGNDGMYGIGLEWKLNDQWSLTGEWERYRMNEWIDAPMLGVRFTF